MDRRTFDAFTRRTALTGLAAAGLATLVSPLASDAKKKNRKRNKNKNKGNVNDLCKQQVGPCVDFVNASCAEGEPECAALLDCCSLLATCDFTELVTCFTDAQQGPANAARLLR